MKHKSASKCPKYHHSIFLSVVSSPLLCCGRQFQFQWGQIRQLLQGDGGLPSSSSVRNFIALSDSFTRSCMLIYRYACNVKVNVFVLFDDVGSGVEVAERFAYYGVAGNLITYLTKVMGEPTVTAARNVNVWSGVSTILPVGGAFVADAYLGRYVTILYSTFIYILVRSFSILFLPPLSSFILYLVVVIVTFS